MRAHCSPGRACRKEGIRLQGLSPGNNRIRKKADAQVKILIPFIPFSLQAPPVGTTCAPTPHMRQASRRAHQEDLAAAPQVSIQHQGRRLQHPVRTLSPRSAADSCRASMWFRSGCWITPQCTALLPHVLRGNQSKSQPL